MTQNSQTGQAGNELVYDEGSIDLLGFVVRHRRLFVFSTLISALMTAGLYAISQALPGSTVATYQISLSFKGAAQGQHPNKTPFSPQDIVGLHVLEPIWAAQGLQERITLTDLARAVTISRSSRDLSMLQADFEQKLANTKLTAAERQALETDFKAKLDALAQTEFTIACSASQLSQGEAERVVEAIPAEWARISEAAGVTAYVSSIPDAREIRSSGSALEGTTDSVADSIMHAELMRSFVERVERTIEALMAVQGTELTTSKSGATLADLQQRVLALQRNILMPAYIDTMAAAWAASPQEYAAITGVRRQMLASACTSSEQRGEVLHEALNRTRTEQSEQRAANTPGVLGVGSDVIANVDGTFIDRVVAQAIRSEDVDYRRTLNDRCVEADLEQVALKRDSDFEVWLEDTIEQRGGMAVTAPSPERLVALGTQVADLADELHEILLTVSKRNLNPASTLYRGDIAPVVTTERTLTTRGVAMAGAGIWFTLLGLSTLAGVVQDRRRALA